MGTSMSMKMVKYSFILSCLCLAHSAFADKRFVIQGGTRMPQLGEGYLDKKDNFSGVCLIGDILQIETDNNSFNFEASSDNSSLSKEMGFELGRRAQIGPAEATMAAKFFNRSASDSHSISVLYSFNYNLKQEILKNERVKPSFQGFINQGENGINLINAPTLWQKSCGDMYVHSRELGARLYISIKIEFSSEEEKKSSQLEAKLKSTLSSVQKTLQEESERLSGKSKITISALQIGGDITKFTKLFTDDNVNPETKGLGRATSLGVLDNIQCEMGDFGKCQKVVANATRYAMRDFPEQVTQPSALAPLAVRLKPYENIKIFKKVNPHEEQESFKTDQREVGKLFDQNYKNYLETKRLLNWPLMRLNPRQSALIGEIDKHISENKTSLIAASKLCFDFPEACNEAIKTLESGRNDLISSFVSYFTSWYSSEGTKTAEIKQKVTISGVKPLKIINLEHLNVFPENFAQYCDLGLKSNFHSPQLTETIKFILASIPRQKFINFDEFNMESDKCLAAERALNEAREIDFSKKTEVVNASLKGVEGNPEDEKPKANRISDLRPIAVLSNLEKLNLDGNFLTDVRLLGKLKNLQSLSLKFNEISDVDGLEMLENLEFLDLSSNQLKDVSVLSGLDKLDRLVLTNNKSEITCPFNNKFRCDIQDFKNTVTFTQVEKTLTPHPLALLAALPNNRVLIAEGFGGKYECFDGHLDSCRVLNESNMGDRGTGSMTVLLDGRVFIFGGIGGARNGTIYNPTSNQFIQIPFHSNFDHRYHTATLLQDGRVLIVGSPLDQAICLAEIFDPTIYDQAQGQSPFSIVQGLKRPRSLHTATLLQDGTVLLVGGLNYLSPDNTAEIFDPTHNTLTMVRNVMKQHRGGHTATLLPSGKVLITGGFKENEKGGFNPIDSAEIFDPETKTFRALPSKMTSARGHHTSTLLENQNYVLIAGGGNIAAHVGLRKDTGSSDNPAGQAWNTAEIFDVARGKFYSTGCEMKFARRGHAAIPIAQSKVLLVGGEPFPNSCEVFDYLLME